MVSSRVLPLNRLFLTGLTLGILLPAALPAAANPAIAPTGTLETITPTSDLDQVTSVSQLSDVQPTDWAFQALQSLVERYGVIAGYPDGKFRGNRALTRYEFAAGLNAALDRVNELIAAGTADLVSKEDLATLQKLQEEFSAELATLRGRVDALEARTATLEAQQFSTTTKLNGEAIFSLSSAYGAATGNQDANITFNQRVRLNLNTSFSGKDLLITGLQAHNFGGGGSLAGTLGYGEPVFNSSNVRLAYEPQFSTLNPSTLTPIANNSFNLYKLLYIFPASQKLTLFVGTGAEVSDAFPAILPFAGQGQGSISRFGQLNPVLRVSGGTSDIGLAAAAGFIWKISDGADLRALYGSVNPNLPVNAGFPGTPLGSGLFNGSYVAAAQLTLKPSSSLDLGLNYAYSYHQLNILGTGLSNSDIGAIASQPLTDPVRMHSVGATLAYRLSPKVTLAGYGSYFFTNSATTNASTNFSSWMVGLHAKDLFGAGNTAGILFGQPLSRISVGGGATNPELATPYHLEGYVNFRLNDNISITPGVFFVFNPEGNAIAGSKTVTVPVIRTTFSF